MPRGHPLRAIHDLTNAALSEMSGEFEALYSRAGRPGIMPEKLLRALLLQAFYSIRSERQLMEQLKFNLLFRWFAGLGIDDRVWDATEVMKNRLRGLARVDWQFTLALAAYDLIRLPKLLRTAA